MLGSVRYTTSADGVRIAYLVAGTGPALVYLPASIISHVGLSWQQPGMRAYFERLSSNRTLIQIDLRGTGLSDRGVPDSTLDAQVGDVLAVLQAVGVDEFDIMTDAHRCSVAVRLAVAHSHRVRRMILRGPILWTSPGTAPAGTRELIGTNWNLWLELNAQRLSVGKAAWEVRHLVEFFRQCVTPEQLLAEMDTNDYYDLERAPHVSCPVRVECRPGVGFNSLEDFAAYAAAFPKGEFVQLPGDWVGPMFGGNSAGLERSHDEFLGPSRPDAALSVREPEATPLDPSGHSNSDGHTMPHASLSPRESEVLRLLASGHTNAEIAATLILSRSTVDRHVANIYAKLSVRNRSEATRWALTHRASASIPKP